MVPRVSPECFTVTILASSLALANAQYGWRRYAVCRDTDPDLFFPVGTTGQALVQIDRAKEVCDQCTVKVDCLEFALETNQDSGIWGGTSEEERRKLRREYVARQKKSGTLTTASVSLSMTDVSDVEVDESDLDGIAV
jgi:WhiB family redox-sensing transcriptional regulator